MSGTRTWLADALTDVQARALREILSANALLSLATVSPAGEAHINTAYFAFTDGFVIYFRSPTETEHARHITVNPTAAVAVFDSHQGAGARRGVQLFGHIAEVAPDDGDSALALFAGRFPGEEAPWSYAEFKRTHGSALYGFHASRVKLFDEHLLASGAYVEILR